MVLPQPLPVPARMNARRLPYPVLFWRSGYGRSSAVAPTSHRLQYRAVGSCSRRPNGGFATTAAVPLNHGCTCRCSGASGYSYAHAVLRPRTAKPPTSRSCWSVTGRQVFWLSLVLARPSQSFDQWFCGVVSITAAGLRGFTPFPDTKLVSYLSFVSPCALHRRVLLFSFTVSSLVTMTSVKESGCAMTIYCSTVFFILY